MYFWLAVKTLIKLHTAKESTKKNKTYHQGGTWQTTN